VTESDARFPILGHTDTLEEGWRNLAEMSSDTLWERTRKNSDYSRGDGIIQVGGTGWFSAICWRLFEEEGI
jgi:hypothetical protein